MADDDFDFRRPPERREAKPFEPPPWEKEAFEQLRSKRVVERPAEAEEPAPEPERRQGAVPPVAESAAGEARAGGEGEKAAGDAPAAGVDEATMTVLMAGLAAEEPPIERQYFSVSMGVALFLVALGAVLLVWSVAAFVAARNSGSVGVFAGAGLAVFGIGFIGGGVWIAYQALKRRGVL